MRFVVLLAHGAFGPFDEILSIVMAVFVALLFGISLVVGRKRNESPFPITSNAEAGFEHADASIDDEGNEASFLHLD
jgi:hypothetical protein